MKLTVKTTLYKHYTLAFKEWLYVLGYGQATVNYHPVMLQEFLIWLENKGITELDGLTQDQTEAFMDYTKTRSNRRREGSISACHINRYIGVIKKFGDYIKQSHRLEIPVNAMRIEDVSAPREILTTDEIKSLYKVTTEGPMGMRDRAMLAIYYGCGLRKSEGIGLDVSDLLIERKMLNVRKSKNNYQRYVPLTAANLKHLEQYMYNARPLLLAEKSDEQGLLISERGKRMSGERAYQRIKELSEKAGISKEVGLHTLRHSIATHLLKSGMELENIALFLGHRCLDSTQIYTHLVNEH